jgi:Mn-containing catalase
MAAAARHDMLRELFEQHRIETGAQVERLNECFSLLRGNSARQALQGHDGAGRGRTSR